MLNLIKSIVSVILSLVAFFVCVFSPPTFVCPYNLSTSEETPIKITTGDFYVSPDGSNNNDGSFSSPFATIERARDAVRELDKTGRSGITVSIMAGEYRVSSIEFTSRDRATQACPVTYCAYGNGEVIINGGVTLKSEDFEPVSGKMKSRLSKDARKNVVELDLGKYSLTCADWGKIYAIGSFNTADKYDGDTTGPIYCELFFNDERMALARYPNSGEFLKTGKIIREGDAREKTGVSGATPGWDELRNPLGDIFTADWKTACRMSKYETLEDVWLFGYWKYTWADSSTPIKSFDAKKRAIETEYVSICGIKKDAPYYIFNAFEELDEPGEWYLDRGTGILYMYPAEDLEGSCTQLSLSTDNIITVTNAHYLNFRNLTVKGTRSNAIEIMGNNNTVDSCVIKNVSGNALIMNGYKNKAVNNEIMHTGRGGIILEGGDRDTLTPGGCIADNNLIHDWSEVYLTYQSAVNLLGAGNVCSHNEIFNSPHQAITYTGNNHMIEYNVIHDVVRLSDDAGAIYAGRNWSMYGNIIRYNCIYNLGSKEHHPQGIYMDDALSGQTIFGNILINIPDNAIEIGGGRDIIIKNNIIINAGRPFYYDERARDGALKGGWFGHCTDLWSHLNTFPWQGDIWKAAYPNLSKIHLNTDNSESIWFAPNPANGFISGNIILDKDKELGRVEDSVFTFSTIEGNAIYYRRKKGIFVNPEKGDYNIKEGSEVYEIIPDFENLPFEQMGRY